MAFSATPSVARADMIAPPLPTGQPTGGKCPQEIDRLEHREGRPGGAVLQLLAAAEDVPAVTAQRVFDLEALLASESAEACSLIASASLGTVFPAQCNNTEEADSRIFAASRHCRFWSALFNRRHG
jgi:hypothetical protein